MFSGRVVVLAVAAVALVVTGVSTGSWSSNPGPAGGSGGSEEGAEVTPTPARGGDDEETTERPLGIHATLPSSLRPGGTRQFRVQVASHPQVPDDALLEVRLGVDGGSSGVRLQPERLLVRRSDLRWQRLHLSLASTVDCDAELGELEIRVREIAHGGLSGERRVPLPAVDCRERPPEPTEALFLEDPVCGDEWRDEIEQLLDDETLDPRRCTEAWWGRTPRDRTPQPRQRGGQQDRSQESSEEAEETEESPEEEPAEESDEPAEEGSEEPAEPPAEEPAEEPRREEPPREERPREEPPAEEPGEVEEAPARESSSIEEPPPEDS